MSCAAARAVASSLLELQGHGGADGVVPFSHEVEARISSRFALHGGSDFFCVVGLDCAFISVAKKKIINKKNVIVQNKKCARLEFSSCRVKPRRPRSRRGPEAAGVSHRQPEKMFS